MIELFLGSRGIHEHAFCLNFEILVQVDDKSMAKNEMKIHVFWSGEFFKIKMENQNKLMTKNEIKIHFF